MNYLRLLNPSNLSAATRMKDPLSIQREILLQRVLNLLLVIMTLLLPTFHWFYPERLQPLLLPVILIYLVILSLTVIRQIDYNLRATVVILTLNIAGVLSLVRYGLNGPGPIFLFGAAVLANMLFDLRIGSIFTALSLAIVLSVGYLMINRLIPLPKVTLDYLFSNPGQWLFFSGTFLILILMIMGAISVIIQGLYSALNEQNRLTTALKTEQASLEQRVDARAADLKNRLNQFEIASEIAREVSGETNLENLLINAVNQIRDRFGFYHVGIFLNDDRGEYAVLRAATGDAGQQMMERNHSLKIGEVGMVGYVVSRGEARISLDVTGELVHYKNPLLPDTRSEMALPLRSGSRTIGALDVQSVLENAFNNEDVRILQTIADQMTIAFEKTNLVEQLQRSVHEMEATHSAATQKAWRTHLRNTRQRMAYRYSHSKLDTYVDETEQSLEAMAKGQPVLKTITQVTAGKESRGTVLAVPIRLRNQVLGVVDIRFASANVSPDLIALIEGTVSRLAVSLENARLLEEIQFRAERERLVSEISSKVHAASDVDSVLQIAIQEIGHSLGVSEVMVQLRKE